MADGTAQTTKTIKAGENFTDLAQSYYGDWTQYQRIVDANPLFASRPPHTDYRYDPSVIAPVLYSGDEVIIPIDPDPEFEAAASEEVKAGKVFTKSGGDAWFRVKHQAPAPKIEVYKPDDSSSPYLTFEATQKGIGCSQKLLNYSFSGGVDDLYGAFSFEIEGNEDDVEGKTPFDTITKQSVVYIYEADENRPAFIGIVKRRRIKSSMAGQGPRRSIVISGKNIISVLAEYMVSLDFKIMEVEMAENASRKLTLEMLSKKELTIKDFMIITWNFFWELGTGKDTNAIASTTAGNIIKAHVLTSQSDEEQSNGIGSCIETGSVKVIHYPIANAPFNQGNNVISELWRNILPQPIYEIYAYCDRKDGKPKIMSREVPFGYRETGNKDWYSLDMYEIDPLDLVDYDIVQSDEEVYTVYCAYLIGSAFSREYNIAKESKKDDIMVKDTEKMNLYGYKPLEVSFRGYDTQGTESDDLKGAFKQLNEKTKYWFGRLDDMYSGTIKLLTDFTLDDNGDDRNPRYGCRAKFLGGEFYITKAEHSWQYGGAPSITLSVTRGMKYGDDGYMKEGNAGVLSEIGKQFKELE